MSELSIEKKRVVLVEGIGKKSGKPFTAIDCKVKLSDGTKVVCPRVFIDGEDEWDD